MKGPLFLYGKVKTQMLELRLVCWTTSPKYFNLISFLVKIHGQLLSCALSAGTIAAGTVRSWAQAHSQVGAQQSVV